MTTVTTSSETAEPIGVNALARETQSSSGNTEFTLGRTRYILTDDGELKEVDQLGQPIERPTEPREQISLVDLGLSHDLPEQDRQLVQEQIQALQPEQPEMFYHKLQDLRPTLVASLQELAKQIRGGEEGKMGQEIVGYVKLLEEGSNTQPLITLDNFLQISQAIINLIFHNQDIWTTLEKHRAKGYSGYLEILSLIGELTNEVQYDSYKLVIDSSLGYVYQDVLKKVVTGIEQQRAAILQGVPPILKEKYPSRLPLLSSHYLHPAGNAYSFEEGARYFLLHAEGVNTAIPKEGENAKLAEIAQEQFRTMAFNFGTDLYFKISRSAPFTSGRRFIHLGGLAVRFVDETDFVTAFRKHVEDNYEAIYGGVLSSIKKDKPKNEKQTGESRFGEAFLLQEFFRKYFVVEKGKNSEKRKRPPNLSLAHRAERTIAKSYAQSIPSQVRESAEVVQAIAEYSLQLRNYREEINEAVRKLATLLSNVQSGDRDGIVEALRAFGIEDTNTLRTVDLLDKGYFAQLDSKVNEAFGKLPMLLCEKGNSSTTPIKFPILRNLIFCAMDNARTGNVQPSQAERIINKSDAGADELSLYSLAGNLGIFLKNLDAELMHPKKQQTFYVTDSLPAERRLSYRRQHDNPNSSVDSKYDYPIKVLVAGDGAMWDQIATIKQLTNECFTSLMETPEVSGASESLEKGLIPIQNEQIIEMFFQLFEARLKQKLIESPQTLVILGNTIEGVIAKFREIKASLMQQNPQEFVGISAAFRLFIYHTAEARAKEALLEKVKPLVILVEHPSISTQKEKNKLKS